MIEEVKNKIKSSRQMSESRKKIIRISFAVALLIASVYYTIKDIDLYKLWYYIVNADYLWVILSVPVMIISHWLRAIRWRTMLQPVIKNANTWNLFSAVMAGYAVNNVIPRGGEFLRPYVFARRQKISYTSVFATIIVERFLDLIILLLMFAGVWLAFSDQLKAALPTLQAEKLLMPVLIIIAVIILSFYPPLVRMVLKVIVRPLSMNLYNRISEMFEKFARGFAIIRKPTQYLRLTVESLSIWLMYTVPMLLMFYSFGFEQEPYSLGVSDAILLLVISGIAFTISPTPGALGVYHFLIQNTLVKLYGVNPAAALAYATVTHGIGYLVQVGIGGLFLLRENIKKIPTGEDIENEEPEDVQDIGRSDRTVN